MAAPVINQTTSVLEGTQWQSFHFQPYATGAPTAWACPHLPTGLTIDEDSGLISGVPEVSGVFVCGLEATNGDGTSDPLVLTIGVEPGPAALGLAGMDVEIDVTTMQATLVGATADLHVFGKLDHDILLWVRFKRAGVVLDLAVAQMKLRVRESDPASTLVLGDDWKKYGSGVGTYYGLVARPTGAALAGALSSYEADAETAFDGRAEIEIEVTNADGDFGPATYLFATRNFPLTLATPMT